MPRQPQKEQKQIHSIHTNLKKQKEEAKNEIAEVNTKTLISHSELYRN